MSAKHLKLKEVELLAYQEPLDAALLLRKDRLYDTFYNAFVHINNLCLRQESVIEDSFPMILATYMVGGYNIEYNALIEGISLGVEESNRDDFLRDFALASGKVKGLQAIPPLWLGYTMESFGITYGSKLRFRGQSYYRPVVYVEKNDKSKAMQMAAVTITERSLSHIFGGNPEISEVLESIDYFAKKISKYEQVAFGTTATKEFWKGKHSTKRALYSIV